MTVHTGKKWMAAALCCLLLSPFWARAESTETGGENAEVADSAPAGTVVTEETVLEPQYEVPDYVQWLLDVARGELGNGEDRGGNTKYGAWAGDPSAEWCAEFVCWCVDQVDQQHGTTLLTMQYPKYFSSNVGRDWFLRAGRYVARKGMVPDWGSQWFKGEETSMLRNSYIPQPGDWVFFSTVATGDTTHVAMVEYCAVTPDGQVVVHVIEGNNPDKVARNTYPLDNWAILGYGTVHDVADTTLRSGCQGVKVKNLQDQLILLGYLEPQYNTGKYAQLTAQAVKNFQCAQGIEQTGVAGQKTQLALEQLVREYYRNNEELWTVGE